jgi:hypothetical protein
VELRAGAARKIGTFEFLRRGEARGGIIRWTTRIAFWHSQQPACRWACHSASTVCFQPSFHSLLAINSIREVHRQTEEKAGENFVLGTL